MYNINNVTGPSRDGDGIIEVIFLLALVLLLFSPDLIRFIINLIR